MINIAVKINDRQYDRSVEKKHGPNPSQKIDHSLKEILWSSMRQKKKLLRLRETVSFKTKLPKKNNGNVGKMD